MSNTIDERVVEMKFDNSNFEKNVSTSMSTIEKLKAKLNFKGAAKGLEEINKSADNISFGTLHVAIDSVSAKFSALQAVAFTVLQNITNRVTDASMRIAKEFTTEPITTGFNEYELKMDSVQTIMMSTGESLDVVMQKLNDLNTYSDKTIYSFSDMTSNIGKFTNAGVKLNDAVSAIQGVANVAAISGANANEASRAMYNFAQALSSGYVKLIDWKSIENANMATVEFKTQLLDCAAAMGILNKTADGMYDTGKTVFNATQNFNDSLQDGWMTTEVLTEVLKAYADETTEIGKKAFAAAQDVKTFSQMMDTLKEAAQSGWATTWEYIIGDFEQAKELFTDLSNIFGGLIDASASARNKIVGDTMTSSFDKLATKLTKAGISMEEFKMRSFEIAKTRGMFDKDIQSLDDLKEAYGSFEKSLQSGWFDKDIFKGVIDSATGAKKEIGLTREEFDHLKEGVKRALSGEFGEGDMFKNNLEKAGYNYVQTMNAIQKVNEGGKLKFKDYNNAQLSSLELTEKQIKKLDKFGKRADKAGSQISELIDATDKPSGRALLMDSLLITINLVVGAINDFKEVWAQMFPPLTSDTLYNIIDGFHTFLVNLQNVTEQTQFFKNVFKGAFAILSIFKTILMDFVNAGLGLFAKLLGRVSIDLHGFSLGISDILVGLADWFKANDFIAVSLEAITNAFVGGYDKIRSWIKEVSEIPVVADALVKAKDIFKNVVEYVKIGVGAIPMVIGLVLMKTGELFTTFFDYIKRLVSGEETFDFSVFLSGFGAIGEKLGEIASELGIDFGSIGDKFSDFRDTLGDIGSSIKDKLWFIRNVVTDFIDNFSKKTNISVGGVLATVLGVGMFMEIKKFLDFLTNLANPFDGMNEFWKGLGKMAKGIGNDFNAKAVKTLAESLAILAGSLFVIAQIPADKLRNATEAMFKLALVLVLLVKAVEGLGTISASFQVSTTLIAIAGSVALIVEALAKLTSLDTEGIEGKLLLLGGIVAALVGVMWAMNKLKIGGTYEQAVLMVSLSLSMYVAVRALEKLASIDVKAIRKNLGELLITFVLLAGLIKVLGKFGSKGMLIGGSAGLLLAAFALIALMTALKMVVSYDPAKLVVGLIEISAMVVVFGKVCEATVKAGPNAAKAGAMLLLVAGSMILFSVAIGMLSTISLSGIAKSVLAMTVLLSSFAVMIEATNKANFGADSFKGILAMAASVAILAASVAILAMLDVGGVLQATVSLGVLILAFSVMLKTLGELDVSVKTIIAIGILVTTIGLLAGAIYLLAKLPNADTAIAAAEAIGILLLAMSASLAVIGTLPTNLPMLAASLGIMLGVIAILAFIIGAMSKLTKANEVAVIADALSNTLLKITAVMAVCTLIGFAAPAAIAGMALLMAFIVKMGALMLVVGGLVSALPGLETAMKTAIKVFGYIGEGIGAIIGGLVKGIVEQSLSVLPKIALSLGIFATGIRPFFKAFNKADTKAIDVFVDLIKALTMANLTSLLSAIPGLSGINTIGTFLDALPKFGVAMKKYAKSVSGLDNEAIYKIKGTAKAAKLLSEVYSSLPKSGGIVGSILGDKDFGSFIGNLSEFGTQMVSLSKNLTEGEVDVKKIKSVATAAKAVSEMANELPRVGGGIDDVFLGSNDLIEFSSRLPEFASHMVAFSAALNAGDAFDDKIVKKAANAAKAIAKMAENLPNTGGTLAGIIGDNSLLEFSESLPELGHGIKSFSDEVQDIDPDKIKAAAKTIAVLSDAAYDTGTGGGIFGWVKDIFVGDTFKDAGKNLETIGTSFGKFYDSVKNISTAKLQSFAEQFTKVVEAMKSAKSIDSGFAQRMKIIADSVKKVSETDISSTFANSANATGAASSVMSTLSEGISNQAGTVKSSMTGVVNEAYKSVMSNSQQFHSAGTLLGIQFSSGILAAKSTATGAASNLAYSAAQGLKGYYSEAYRAGEFFGSGFRSGILSKARTIAEASAKVVRDALNAARKEADEHSPSKETHKIGAFMGMGLVNGLLAFAGRVADAGSYISRKAIDGMHGLGDAINDILSGANAPVISPVLDLSSVRRGASQISGIFDNVTLGGNVNSISRAMRARQKDSTNSDVVRAIKGLGNNIDNAIGDTYTIGDVTYGSDDAVANAVRQLVQACLVERRV